MKKLLLSAAITSFASLPLSADMLGIYVGTGNWKPEASGNISNASNDEMVFGSSGVDIRDKNQTGFYLAFEHPIPIIPNAMITEQDLKSSGSGPFTGNFGGETFVGNVDTEFDMSHRDYTLYYEILDNWVNLDLGLTARQFDGYVFVSDGVNSTNEKFDETLPMLYGKARFDLPLTGLSVSAILNHISQGGNSVTDTSLFVGYETSIGLGIEGGIRTFSLEVDDEDDFTADLEFDGMFINATYHF
ncbi:MAG: TIGR04219 family outer membrane beta-barrel protein [Gammaproteobacteria bacterium]|nr:TIGR04219 family outer membrane beta-barrel protein [Gammaproteobacteria bacterium]